MSFLPFLTMFVVVWKWKESASERLDHWLRSHGRIQFAGGGIKRWAITFRACWMFFEKWNFHDWIIFFQDDVCTSLPLSSHLLSSASDWMEWKIFRLHWHTWHLPLQAVQNLYWELVMTKVMSSCSVSWKLLLLSSRNEKLMAKFNTSTGE